MRMGAALARDVESRRRAITFGGSFLWIPAAGAASLAISAAFGMKGIWLLFAALVGLAAGPALTTVSIAGLTLVGLPMARRRFQKKAARLGLVATEAATAWDSACDELDDEMRSRLGRKGNLSGA